MEILCSNGFKISNPDKLVLNHYLRITPQEWAENALKGMINKARKTILNDWYDLYKSQYENDVPCNCLEIVPEIILLAEFQSYNIQIPSFPIVKRKESQDIEIWPGGFNVQINEKIILNSFYENTEKYLEYLMENKIYSRRQAFIEKYQKEMLKDPEITSFPVNEDDFINFITSQEDYKKQYQYN